MIKANELRIGNLLLSPIGEYKQVKNIQDNSINQLIDGDGVCGSYLLDNFSGIPLTPGILGKCGFQKASTGGYYKDTGNAGMQITFFEHDEFYSIAYVGTRIKHLHQLQNLFYCLCGEELVINIA